jgi:hypothetical protein
MKTENDNIIVNYENDNKKDKIKNLTKNDGLVIFITLQSKLD